MDYIIIFSKKKTRMDYKLPNPFQHVLLINYNSSMGVNLKPNPT